MPRQPSIPDLLHQGEAALSTPAPTSPAAARRLRRLARVRERMRHYAPSERNLKIFENVVIRHMTHQEVACLENISRRRVARIVERMRQWFAICGGDDAAFAPEQRYRLASHVARRELAEFQRRVELALFTADQLIESKKVRYNDQGEPVCHERSYQGYPRPTGLYKLLLTAILAKARLAGAGRDNDADPLSGGRSQAMVISTEVNGIPTAQSPPNGALPSDVLSDSTSVDVSASAIAPTQGAMAN